MYLLEETTEARELRQKVASLLLSEDSANVAVALTLIESGGWHPIFFPPLWVQYAKTKPKAWHQNFEAFIETLPVSVQEDIRLEKIRLQNDRWRDANALLNRLEFWKIVASEGLFDLPTLLKMWENHPFYTQKTALTRYLLEQYEHIDKHFFLHNRLTTNDLRFKGVGKLFEAEDANFDKMAFLRRFLVGKTLDLTRTSLDFLPAEVMQMPDWEVLNIQGTNLQDLPAEVLHRAKDIIMNKHTKRHVYSKILKTGKFDYFFAQKTHFVNGLRLWRDRYFAEALPCFEIAEPICTDSFFTEKDRKYFWEGYFGCLMQAGRQDEALVVLQKAMQYLRPPLVFHWRWQEGYWVYWLVADRENELLDIFKQYVQGTSFQANMLNFLSLSSDYMWRWANEWLAYRDRIADNLKLFEKMKHFCIYYNFALTEWRWAKIFNHLQSFGKFESIVQLFEHHESTIFYNAQGRTLQTSSHQKCCKVWIEALIAVGKLEKAEMLCTQYFNDSPAWTRFVSAQLAKIYAQTGRQVCSSYFAQNGLTKKKQ